MPTINFKQSIPLAPLDAAVNRALVSTGGLTAIIILAVLVVMTLIALVVFWRCRTHRANDGEK
jgi:heme/copper-type cytochrome/quinol oxidase subunit 2